MGGAGAIAALLAAVAALATPAAAPADPQPHPAALAAGRTVFLATGCGGCHTIRGTAADGTAGPDLTHLASRQTLAGALLPNTRGNLAGWITNPQSLKPGALMPALPIAPADLQLLLDYLMSLQ